MAVVVSVATIRDVRWGMSSGNGGLCVGRKHTFEELAIEVKAARLRAEAQLRNLE
jgi:hypothetical protein